MFGLWRYRRSIHDSKAPTHNGGINGTILSNLEVRSDTESRPTTGKGTNECVMRNFETVVIDPVEPESKAETVAVPLDPPQAGSGFCTSCGARRPEGIKFCGQCGSP